MSERWEAKSLAAIPTIGQWIPVRRDLGVSAFGINAWKPNDKGVVIGEHDEKQLRHEELYVVVEGHATFTVAGDEIDAPAGTLVYVRDPEAKRTATGTPETVVLAVGAKPGEAYTTSAWEGNAPGFQAYQDGDYERALELFEEGAREFPDSPNLLYNIACMHAVLGDREKSLENLRRTLELDEDERFLKLAREDSDFDSLRDDPEFQALVSPVAGKPDAVSADA
jgi:tetratricopeptide (TPR) repeat protein